MSKVIIEVMPKPDILDPQGRAVGAVLARSGVEQFSSIRVGKRFELILKDRADEAVLEATKKLAQELLANSVIEDVVSVRIED